MGRRIPSTLQRIRNLPIMTFRADNILWNPTPTTDHSLMTNYHSLMIGVAENIT